MSVTDVNSRVAVVNAEIKRLNDERQVNIGRKEALTLQLKAALESYQKNYGVSLDADSIDAEIQSVTTQVEQDIQRIEHVLALIQNGEYAKVEAELHGEPVEPEKAGGTSEPLASTPKAPVVPNVPMSEPSAESTISSSPVEPPKVEQTIPTPPPVEVPRVKKTVTAPPVESPKSVSTSPVETAPADPPLAPPPGFGGDGFTTQGQGSPVSSFSQILNGSLFNPQGGAR